MKLQGSPSSDDEILQFTIGQNAENRLILNRLAIVHDRLTEILELIAHFIATGELISTFPGERALDRGDHIVANVAQLARI